MLPYYIYKSKFNSRVLFTKSYIQGNGSFNLQLTGKTEDKVFDIITYFLR